MTREATACSVPSASPWQQSIQKADSTNPDPGVRAIIAFKTAKRERKIPSQH
ncbi:rCG27064 [Rattus norvegicus]|uniref:RCG27064 n=1 Tax=Rattus norvegicus TaxID=10116 RepID=A6HNF6_RAT|nr:rCG27064 [Rattus norvegicus]